jgi:integrase
MTGVARSSSSEPTRSVSAGSQRTAATLSKVQNEGLAKGYMFPSRTGTLRTPNSLDAAWRACLEKAKIGKRFTVHGLRYTFTDLVRRANVDAVVRRALTGHVTEEMQRHYSHVGIDGEARRDRGRHPARAAGAHRGVAGPLLPADVFGRDLASDI